MPDTTTIQIVEEVTQLSVSNANDISVTLIDDPTVLTVNNFAIPDAVDASTQPENIPVSVSGMSSTNLADALAELASSNFRSDTAPTGPNVNEGDQWYDTDDNQLKVYRETSPGVFQWVALIVGSDDSDTVDAGSF